MRYASVNLFVEIKGVPTPSTQYTHHLISIPTTISRLIRRIPLYVWPATKKSEHDLTRQLHSTRLAFDLSYFKTSHKVKGYLPTLN